MRRNNAKSITPIPKATCPFIDEFNQFDCYDFCRTCINFVRYPEDDDRKLGIAYVCKLNEMTPDEIWEEPEPDMPWD